MHIGLLGTPRSLGKAVRPELQTDLPADTVLSGWPSRVGVFPSSPVELALQTLGHLEAGLSAAAAGCTAVVIDSVADYGIEALRAALAIPVIGAGEAGMAAAARHGRFAIVTVWPASMNFAPQQVIARHGHQQACLAIHNVAPEGIVAGPAGPGAYLERIARSERTLVADVVAAIAAAADEGAAAVMLGCTCMSPMAATVAAASPLPVINPLREGVRAAVALAGSAKGVVTPRAALVHRMIDAIAGEADEACPVCVSTTAG